MDEDEKEAMKSLECECGFPHECPNPRRCGCDICYQEYKAEESFYADQKYDSDRDA